MKSVGAAADRENLGSLGEDGTSVGKVQKAGGGKGE